MFNVRDISNTEEFVSAGIKVKTIRMINGEPCEDMSFPAFKFAEVAEQEWEKSDWYETVMSTRFWFVIFEKRGNDYYLKDAKFWNVPLEDIEVMRGVWEDTKRTIIDGVEFELHGTRMFNNFIPETADRLIHVRSHTTKSAYHLNNGYIRNPELIDKYTDRLPSGDRMPYQCFWFNKQYIKDICAD